MDNNNFSPYEVMDSRQAPMSVGQYLGTMLLMAIPLVGLILGLVWGFSSDTNVNKKNLCRASLILQLIVFVLYILFSVLIFSAVSSTYSSM